MFKEAKIVMDNISNEKLAEIIEQAEKKSTMLNSSIILIDGIWYDIKSYEDEVEKIRCIKTINGNKTLVPNQYLNNGNNIKDPYKDRNVIIIDKDNYEKE